MSDQQPAGRVAVLFRETPDFAAQLTKRAAEHDLVSDRGAGKNRMTANRSELIRILLRWAFDRIPAEDIRPVGDAEPTPPGLMVVGAAGTSLHIPVAVVSLMVEAVDRGFVDMRSDAAGEDPDDAAQTIDTIRNAESFVDWIKAQVGM